MAKHDVSIASVIQNPSEKEGTASLVMTTHESDERAVRATLQGLRRSNTIVGEPVLLRIDDFQE